MIDSAVLAMHVEDSGSPLRQLHNRVAAHLQLVARFPLQSNGGAGNRVEQQFPSIGVDRNIPFAPLPGITETTILECDLDSQLLCSLSKGREHRFPPLQGIGYRGT